MSHKAEYLINNVIAINPEFAKSKRLKELQKAKDKLANAVQDLRAFDAALKTQDQADPDSAILTRSRLVDDVKKLEAELVELKKPFQYKRNNNAKEVGRVLNGRNRKKLIHKINFLYRKWREKPDAAKFLWYTLTFPGWDDFRAYDPKTDDVIIGDQFKRFLEALRRFYGVSNYVWVAEPQTGKRRQDNFGLPTNAIHYHVVLVQRNDKYLNVQFVNWFWLTYMYEIGARCISPEQCEKFAGPLVEILGKFGYERLKRDLNPNEFNFMARINQKEYYLRDKEKVSLAGKVMYNPVDCEQISDPKKLATYLAKYVTKNATTDDKRDDDPDSLPPRPVYTAAWACSRELASIKTKIALAIEISDYEEELRPHIFKTHIIRKELVDGKMNDLETLSYDGFPPDFKTEPRPEVPEVDTSKGEKKSFRKLYQYVRIVLKESVFKIEYFANLMREFTSQHLTLFEEPKEVFVYGG